MMLSFAAARRIVIDKIGSHRSELVSEKVPLHHALGRVLAEEIVADRDYPPFPRSTRDGFAVRAADLALCPVELDVLGEIQAGSWFDGTVGPGQCVQIMTGAPVPEGADAVVMIEHTRNSNSGKVMVERSLSSGENLVPRGSEGRKGSRLLPCGRRLGSGEIGLLASVGKAEVVVTRQPRVAVLPTGDELVPLDQEPEWFQIRNSNAAGLCAQILAAGALPRPLEIAPDRYDPLRDLMVNGLEADLLVLTGGVSMGKYDIVEQVLADLGAKFYFTGVAIRPGKPLVFGCIGGRFFFGLPGNPVSAFVTFEMFVRPALDLLSRAPPLPLTFLRARLGSPLELSGGLTSFLPAQVEVREGEPVVELIAWRGSGDLLGLASANCLLVAHPDQTHLPSGTWVDVWSKN